MHSHGRMRKGYALQTPDELAQQRATFNSDPRYMSEDEMAAHFVSGESRLGSKQTAAHSAIDLKGCSGEIAAARRSQESDHGGELQISG
jgi:hypothetical protein